MSNASDDAATPSGALAQLALLKRPFWMTNVMEMIERLAYYGVRVVAPIYICQADEPGGLHFTMAQKGVIYMWWWSVPLLRTVGYDRVPIVMG